MKTGEDLANILIVFCFLFAHRDPAAIPASGFSEGSFGATVTVGIDGFGRIGRCTLAHFADPNRRDMPVVAISAKGPVETNAHVLRHDSVHGHFPGAVKVTDDGLDLGRRPIRVMSNHESAEPDLGGVDAVLEYTGSSTAPTRPPCIWAEGRNGFRRRTAGDEPDLHRRNARVGRRR